MSIEQTVGNLICKTAPGHPVAARRMLEAAFSYVAAKRHFLSSKNMAHATEIFNGEIAHHLVKGLSKPETSVMVNIYFPCELLHAFGLTVMFPEVLSVYLACTFCATYYIDAAEKRAYPSSLCSYHKTTLGAAEEGLLRPPLCVANTTLACDANNVTFRSLAEKFSKPQLVIDVPYSPSQENVVYVANQLEGIFYELKNSYGANQQKLSLEEVCQTSYETLLMTRHYLNARKDYHLKTSLTSELCSLISTHCMAGTKAAKTYLERITKEARHGLPRKNSKLPRIFWVHTMPNWQLAYKTLFDDASVAELVGNDMFYDTYSVLDELDPTKPFEYLAKKLVYSSVNGSSIRRADTAISLAKSLHADAIILFGQGGCKQTLGMTHILQEKARTAHLPFLEIDGDGCDKRQAFGGQSSTRLEAFLEQVGFSKKSSH